jgi:hypothetical protein
LGVRRVPVVRARTVPAKGERQESALPQPAP